MPSRVISMGNEESAKAIYRNFKNHNLEVLIDDLILIRDLTDSRLSTKERLDFDDTIDFLQESRDKVIQLYRKIKGE